MTVHELGHIVLYVRNLDRSAAFYRETLGWRQILGRPIEDTPAPVAAFSAPGGRTHHELLLIEVGQDAASQPQGRHVGLYHFGLKVGDTDDELRATLADLQAHDVTIVSASDTPARPPSGPARKSQVVVRLNTAPLRSIFSTS